LIQIWNVSCAVVPSKVSTTALVKVTPSVETSTEVLEGAQGFTDSYSVALTAAPGALETVTVTLLTDGQVSVLAQLVFNASNWMTPQTVLVTAVDDLVRDGIEISTIRHRITSAGGSVYATFTDEPGLTVTVYDNETPGVVVQQTGGYVPDAADQRAEPARYRDAADRYADHAFRRRRICHHRRVRDVLRIHLCLRQHQLGRMARDRRARQSGRHQPGR
jgi:hypothetical protein